MHYISQVLAVLALLFCAGNTISTLHDGIDRQSRLPRAPSLPNQRNLTTLPSLLEYASYSLSMLGTPLIHALGQQACNSPNHRILGNIVRFAPHLPFSKLTTFAGGPHGLYHLSSYTEVRKFPIGTRT